MKCCKQLLIIVIFLSISSLCCAQQLIESTRDVSKIILSKERFIGKPLKNLLEEIKPEIKIATAVPSAYPEHPDIGYFNFKFINVRQNDSLRSKGKTPITIIVYVKGPFSWNTDERRMKNFIWTEEDENEYGKLIVQSFRVYGKE